MSHSCLGGVVGSLGLRDIDNGTRHAANHDNTSRNLSFHEVLGHRHSVQIGTVDIDTPKLLHAVMGVRNGIVVFGEAGRGDEVVHFAMLLQDLGEGLVDGGRTRNIAEMGCDFGDSGVVSAKARCLTDEFLLSL